VAEHPPDDLVGARVRIEEKFAGDVPKQVRVNA
jgi:hypothetical protein